MRIWQIIGVLLFIGIVTIQCAQPRPITGGKKDVDSPKILQSNPHNLSTNFTGNSLSFEFDEYIQVKNLSGNLLVSPPLNNEIKYRISGKKLVIELSDTLAENTTYNFNFGESISDLNEGNVLDSNIFVLSTGSFIDSGSVSGIVKNSLTLKPVADAQVLLFNSTDDSAIFKGNPAYITKTSNGGSYELKYLSDQPYQIYVLQNPGDHFQYVRNTPVAFTEGLAQPMKNEQINFFTFLEKDTSQFLEKEFSKNYFSFHLSYHSDLDQPKFQFEPKSEDYVIEELKADSFLFWIKGDKDIDTVTVFVQDKNGFHDTISVDVYEREEFYKKLKKQKHDNSPVQISLNNTGTHHYFQELKMVLSRPVTRWNTDNMQFVSAQDTVNVKDAMGSGILEMTLPPMKNGATTELRQMEIKHDWVPNQNYEFILYPGAFTDLINQTNDTTILKFKTKTFEEYGSFKFKIKVNGYSGSFYLELLDSKGVFIRKYSLKSGEEIYHPLAVPGKYQIRMVIDENGNDQWDTGDLEKKIQPEALIYYKGIIEIRANWDVEETWSVELK